MKIVLNEFGGEKILLSGKKSHFICSADFSFPEKWDGVWAGDRKLLDYIAIKAGDRWLSRESLKLMEYHGHKAVFVFDIGYPAILTLFAPEEKPAVIAILDLEHEEDVEIEIGVDVRSVSENVHWRNYEVQQGRKSIAFHSEAGSVFMKSNEEMETVDMHYKIHTNGGQRCLVWRARGSAKRLELSFSSEPVEMKWAEELKAKEEYYSSLISHFKSDNKLLDRAYKWAVLSLEQMLKAGEGLEMFAGYPWFLTTWGRDAAISIPAFTDLGQFRKARLLLEGLARHMKDGRIPNTYKPEDWFSADATLWWIIALWHYVSYTGDVEFLRKMEGKLKEAMDFLFSLDMDGDGLLETDYGENHDERRSMTWMDTFPRPGKTVDINGLWIKALESFYRMRELSGGYGNYRYLDRIRKRYVELFFSGEWKDVVPGGARIRGNMLIPAFLGILPESLEREVYEVAKRELLGYGIRSLSRNDPEYSPTSYHGGMSWGLLSFMFLHLAYRLGKKEDAEWLLSDFMRHGIGHFSEVWNPETGESMGCFAQAWSAAMLVRFVHESMLGIRVNGIFGTVMAEPVLNGNVDITIATAMKKMRFVFRNGERDVYEIDEISPLVKDFYRYMVDAEGYEPRDREDFLLQFFSSLGETAEGT